MRHRISQSQTKVAGMTVVGIADLAVIQSAGQLVTYSLGSCVGVVGYDPARLVAGLLHVLLPLSTADTASTARRMSTYADTGVPMLAEAMSNLGANVRSIRFKLAGGAAMLRTSEHLNIGQKNVLAVRKALYKGGLLVDAEDVGGSVPRTMIVDVATGRVAIRSPGRPERSL